MLLNKQGALRTDDGSALMAVIGVMAVALIVTVAVASATMSSLGFTGATRASVQAQSAAEAGLAYTEAQLAKACSSGTYSSSDLAENTNELDFSVQVYHSTTEVGTDWTEGCGTPAAKLIKLVSTGRATAVGLPSNTTGDRRVIEAIYSGEEVDYGAAVYVYSTTAAFNASSKVLQVDESVKPSILVRYGDVVCDGGTKVAADLAAASGNIKISGSCHVSGDVWASGTVATSGNVKIDGDVTSLSAANDSMTLTGVRVMGDAWAGGSMKLAESTVAGRVTAANLDLAGGNVGGDAWVAGAVFVRYGSSIGGHLTAKSTNKSGLANGGSTIIPSGPIGPPAAPPTPFVPDWVDFDYDRSDWAGFNEISISGTCDWTKFNTAAAALASGPGIIDARACTGPVKISDYQKLELRDDLAIIAKSFDLGGSAGFTAKSEHKLWLISPDTVADGKPTCPAGSTTVGSFTVGGGFTLEKTVHAMIYSPCKVSITSGINWYGQVYSGNVTINGSATLNFIPVGLPGVNLSDGTVTAPGSSHGLGERMSIRDLGRNG